MRNAWRVLAFDVAAPLAAIAALLAIGVVLAWPAWWVSMCSVLVLLIVEGVAVNVFLLRRDSALLDRPLGKLRQRFLDPGKSLVEKLLLDF